MESVSEKSDIIDWLLTEARFLNDGKSVVEQIGERLVASGVPVSRLRIAQRFSNPLMSAWGTIWRGDGTPAEEYTVATDLLATNVWIGSPFQYVTENRTTLRKRLDHLDRSKDHHVYFELAEQGGKDFVCLPIEYGDGSVQGMSIVSNHDSGFSKEHLELFDRLRNPVAMVMEPLAARRSLSSLLKTYLGHGPSESVISGAIHQGDVTRLNAIIMMTDLRDFTAKSALWDEERLLLFLGQYFEIVVTAVQEFGGDVLKFMGDGILAVFPASTERSAQAQNTVHAAKSAQKAMHEWNKNHPDDVMNFGIGIHSGEVIYGNIGSQSRLDFTVIGDAVNVASRIETMTKSIGEPILCSNSVAKLVPDLCVSVGKHQLRGLPEASELFTLKK